MRTPSCTRYDTYFDNQSVHHHLFFQDIDETVVERLIGLTEMFPDVIRNAAGNLGSFSWKAMQWSFSFSKSALWVAMSAGTILVLPVMFENERAQMLDQQKLQEKQV